MKTKQPTSERVTRRLVSLLSSRYFFLAIIVFFAFQMIWIALSAIYPMLFDEEYHLGIIEIYSRQLSPFITAQPPEAAFHGDITRYSSYFFHYVMSFPYRIISLLTQDLMTQVIIMRLVCVGLVLTGLWLFRKVLLGFGVARATTHVTLLMFTLIPLVPFALAQINYDALLFVMIPLLLLLTQKITRRSNAQAWYVLLFITLAGCAVVTKFTMLPIILGCVMYASLVLYRQYHHTLFRVLYRQLCTSSRLKLFVTGIFLLISLGLVTERYAVNLVTYKALEPSCERLHSFEECSEYTVFRRNTSWQARSEANPQRMNPLEYSASYWVPHIFSDFTVTAAFVYQDKSDLALRVLPTNLQASAGNPLLRYGSWVILVLSIITVAIATFKRQLAPKSLFALFGLLFVIYSAALWFRNYTDYLSIGTPVAAQGRYYIWLLIPVIVMVALALKTLSRNVYLYIGALTLSLLLLTQGGGVANYMLYSNKSWYWPRHEQTIESAHRTAQRILRSFTPL